MTGGDVLRRCGLVLLIAASLGTAAARAADERLAAAARRNDAAAVRTLLAQHAPVNARQADGSTALLWATYHNDVDTVARLLQAGADVTAANIYGETPLSIASESGRRDLVAELLEAGADATAVNGGGDTMLMLAARSGSAETVRLLLGSGADVNAREPTQHQTALMWATAHRYLDAVDALLKAGADVNAASARGSTALHFAVQQGDTEIAKRLLAAGADVHGRMTVRQIDGFTLGLVETLDGVTPLLLAIADCRQDSLEYDGAASALVVHPISQICPVSEDLGILLLDHGADANATDGSRVPPLTQAARARMNRLAAALIAHGARVDASLPPDARQWTGQARTGARTISPIPSGATAYFVAAWSHNPALMRTLLGAGADARLAAGDGTTALMAASGVAGRFAGTRRKLEGEDLTKAVETVKLAVERDNRVNTANGSGRTPLHGAAAMAWDEVVTTLVESGARLDVRDDRGDTPLAIAERAKSDATIALLKRMAASSPSPQH